MILEDWKALSEGERRRRREKAYRKMRRADFRPRFSGIR